MISRKVGHEGTVFTLCGRKIGVFQLVLMIVPVSSSWLHLTNFHYIQLVLPNDGAVRKAALTDIPCHYPKTPLCNE